MDATESIAVRGEVFGNGTVDAIDYWAGQPVRLEPGKTFELGPRSAKLFVIRRNPEGNPVT
jgi:hypothetical protein